MKENEIKIFLIQQVADYKFLSKFNKFRVELRLFGESKKVCWSSEKQMNRLLSLFEDDYLYSTKTNAVYCAMDGDRFIWADKNEGGKKGLEKWLCG